MRLLFLFILISFQFNKITMSQELWFDQNAHTSNHYNLFLFDGLEDPKFSQAELRARYDSVRKFLQGKMNQDNISNKQKRIIEGELKKIDLAFSILSNDKSRKIYNEKLPVHLNEKSYFELDAMTHYNLFLFYKGAGDPRFSKETLQSQYSAILNSLNEELARPQVTQRKKNAIAKIKKRIDHAFAILSDEKKRLAYDRYLHSINLHPNFVDPFQKKVCADSFAALLQRLGKKVNDFKHKYFFSLLIAGRALSEFDDYASHTDLEQCTLEKEIVSGNSLAVSRGEHFHIGSEFDSGDRFKLTIIKDEVILMAFEIKRVSSVPLNELSLYINKGLPPGDYNLMICSYKGPGLYSKKILPISVQ